jgi:hypothetical protein
MIRKKIYLMSKPENLIRLAKWAGIETKGISHAELAERVYFHLLY